MLKELDIRELKTEFSLNVRGLIQVGSFVGKKFSLLKEVGFTDFVLIEANPNLIHELRNNVGNEPTILNALVTDVDDKEYDFYIGNHIQASSVLEFYKHVDYYPELSKVTETIKLKGTTLDSLLKRESVDISKFNFLMMDVQGAEKMVLDGFKNNIQHIDYIYTELNFDVMYRNCVLENELTNYLQNENFYLAKFFDTGFGWGDGLYIRKTAI
jgi:FkbM family methyltransferase